MRSPTEEPGIREYLAHIESKNTLLKDILSNIKAEDIKDFQEKFLISWVYHDNALEGVVLTYHELKCAIDQDIVSDTSLIPTYDEIRAHKAAVELVYELGNQKTSGLNLDIMKRIYACLDPTVGDVKLVRYRKETPLHRLYFHEISPPEKISYRMRRLVEWLGTSHAQNMNPIKLAAKVHFRLMHIYPFPKGSGKLARLVMNFILMRAGYQPGIIHATERQRYYDILRSPHSGLTALICESMVNSTESAIKHFSELQEEQSIAGKEAAHS